jgi:hypothetical protein
VFLGKLVEAIDRVTEGACVLDVLPCESGQTGCVVLVVELRGKVTGRKLTAERRDGCVHGFDQDVLAVKLQHRVSREPSEK